jgi:hypothetical protein
MNELTLEQIDAMTLEEVRKELKSLERRYKLNRPIQEYLTEMLWDDLEKVINTLARLEDREAWIIQYGHLSNPRKPQLLNTEQQ